MHRLAIVVPAWKPEFLAETLASLASQTDRRFRVYVGDDAGPPEIGAIVGRFPELDLSYHRFDENLGGTALPAQWNRCIRRSSEPWVWLFSDDDVMDPGCVAAFHAAVDDGVTEDLLRFPTRTIDAAGRTVRTHPPHPSSESGKDFLLDRLRGRRQSFAVEYVVRRSAFEAGGGFPDYPAGWCADDVAWFTFAGSGGIRTLPAGEVGWRASGLNITDASKVFQQEKLEAAARFLRFIETEVRSPSETEAEATSWSEAELRWILDQVRYLVPLPPELRRLALRTTDGRWHRPRWVRRTLIRTWDLRARIRRRDTGPRAGGGARG